MNRRRALIWGLAAAPVVVLLVGFMLPNGERHEIEFLWWWSWVLPLRTMLTVCLGLGALSGALAVGVLWLGERRRRRRAELSQSATEGEVNALRRLLGRPAEQAEAVEVEAPALPADPES